MNNNNTCMSICGTNLEVLQEELSKKSCTCICKVMEWGGWVEKREGEMKNYYRESIPQNIKYL